MNHTFQFKDQNVFEHGLSVNKYFHKLTRNIDSFPVPDLLKENWEQLKPLVYHVNILNAYQIYHDCGKPFCRTVDSDGKQHFPDHAKVSHDVFKSAFSGLIPKHDLDIILSLILNDMVFHSGSTDEINRFLETNKDNKQLIFTLWLTNLVELYSNAQMFGGYDSLSFKIKYKKLEKIFKKVYNIIKKD